MSLIHMMLEYPARISTVAESGILAFFRTEELKSLGEELLAMDREGRVMQDASSLVGSCGGSVEGKAPRAPGAGEPLSGGTD